MLITKTCLVCGASFSCKASHINRAKYCSTTCQKRGQTKTGFKLTLPSGCIEWLGGKHQDLYRWFRTPEGKQVHAHRWFWEGEYGSVPPGLELHHLCENPACVNPDHLKLVTRQEHRAVYHRKDHCRQGHPYSPENTRRYSNNPNRRVCITCERIWRKKYNARHKTLFMARTSR